MDFFKIIKKRTSIRSYNDRPVSEEQVTKLLKAANAAPSAGNLQSYKIVAIRDEELKDDLVEASHGQKFIRQAPVVFVFLQDRERSSSKYGERGELYSLQDGTIAATYLQLAGIELGLDSCWVGAFDDDEVADLLETDKQPLAIIPVGYAKRSAGGETARREIEEMVRFVE